MLEQSRVAVCRRCGIGFLVTPNYRDHLLRWGARVSVPQLCARRRSMRPMEAGRTRGRQLSTTFATP